MKAITILQPWAALIMCGAKKIETRSWATSYRGKIAIHAGKSEKYFSLAYNEPFKSSLSQFWKEKYIPRSEDFPDEWIEFEYGKVIAIADLVDCQQFKHSLMPGRNTILLNGKEVVENEIMFGDCTPGRWGWILDNIQCIEPIPAIGQQRLWNFEYKEY